MARVLLLGGLDPSGGAGVTLDAAVVAGFGHEPLPIAVSLTVQGLRGFERAEPVAPAVLEAQLACVLRDGPVRAVKVGFVGAAEQAALVARLLERVDDVPVVVDPVLSATSGGLAAGEELVAAYRECLLPRATLLTPNLPEFDALAGGGGIAGLFAAGVGGVLRKGGHGEGAHVVDELWLSPDEAPVRFTRERFDCGPVRGTGCALATAIACRLAAGDTAEDACRGAKAFVRGLLRDRADLT